MLVDPRACGAAAYLLAMAVVVADHPRWAGRGLPPGAGIHHSGNRTIPGFPGHLLPLANVSQPMGSSPARPGRVRRPFMIWVSAVGPLRLCAGRRASRWAFVTAGESIPGRDEVLLHRLGSLSPCWVHPRMCAGPA